MDCAKTSAGKEDVAAPIVLERGCNAQTVASTAATAFGIGKTNKIRANFLGMLQATLQKS